MCVCACLPVYVYVYIRVYPFVCFSHEGLSNCCLISAGDAQGVAFHSMLSACEAFDLELLYESFEANFAGII